MLATGLWAMATLGWVGSPAWIWVGGGLLQIVGHAFSWQFRGQHSVVRAVVIGTAIAASLPLVPGTVQAGATGDWLPAAHFVLLFQGIASFELRTRIGLYTSIVLSGVILFFATQRALDPVYGVFLTGFTVLVLSFLAMAYLIDHVHNSDVHWFRRRLAFAWFWVGVLVASFSLSLLAFLALPKNFMDPQNGLQGVILPFRSTGNFNGTQPSPLGAPMASALPVTGPESTGDQSQSRGDEPEPQRSSSGLEAAGSSQGEDGGEATGLPEDTSTGGTEPALSSQLPGQGGSENGNTLTEPGDLDVEGLVMQVRSPVLTYWRGQVFEEFDGSEWQRAPSFISARRLGDDRVMLQASGSSGRMGGPFYPQTYLMSRQPKPGMVFTGYSPVNAVLPSDENGAPDLVDDSIYRVISAFPDFSPDALEEARSTSRLSQAFHYLPDSVDTIVPLARDLTDIAHTDLARTRRIVSYLDSTFEYDVDARDQLALSMHPTEFLAEAGKGTAMDFATASVLLARAAGVPARLVTGYLPGNLDPLSGTYLVRESDAHAWSEIYFDGIGWVPFDSVPRPETAAFGPGGTSRSPLSDSLFGTSLSEDVLDAVKGSPDSLHAVLSRLTNGPMALAAGAGGVIVVVLSFVGFMAWRGRRGLATDAYSRLEGAYRQEVLAIQRQVDRMLSRAGLGSRRPTDTIGDRWDSATWLDAAGLNDLRWLKRAAWAAAYDPAPFDDSLVFQARDRAASIDRFLTSKPGRPANLDSFLT